MTSRSEELKDRLTAELTTLQALWKALQAEEKALLGNAVDALEDATRTKNAALLAHRDSQQLRLRWTTEAGLATDLPLSQLITEVSTDISLEALVNDLAELASRCQDANRRNGGLILRLQDHTRGALQVLRGDTPEPDVYSLSGAQERRVDGKSLGKA